MVNFWIQDLFKNRGLTLETSDSEFLTSSFIWLKYLFLKKNQNRQIYALFPEGPVERHPYDMVHIYFYELIAVIKQAYKSKKSKAKKTEPYGTVWASGEITLFKTIAVFTPYLRSIEQMSQKVTLKEPRK